MSAREELGIAFAYSAITSAILGIGILAWGWRGHKARQDPARTAS